MKKIALALAALAAVSCGAQRKTVSDNKSDVAPVESVTAVKSAASAETGKVAFALSLFNASLSGKSLSANVVVSPYSAGMALSMLAEGASGQTKEELTSALNHASFAGDKLKGDKSCQLSSANSIWLRDGFSVLPAYKSLLTGSYSAEINSRDFSSPATVKEINRWCSDKTNRRIPEIIDEISPEMVMFILNALYFKAPWEYQFDKNSTIKDIFHSPSGDQEVDFMRIKRQFSCAEYEGGRFVILPYKDGAWQMMICLPDEGADIQKLVSSVSSEMFSKAVADAEYREVALSMPKFKIDNTLILNSVLQSLGVNRAFTPAAEFGNMTQSSVAVDEVKQKCFVEVNEEGAEAAAVTSIGVRLTSVRPEPIPFRMTVDRPFIFTIFNSEVDEILFVGKIGTIND